MANTKTQASTTTAIPAETVPVKTQTGKPAPGIPPLGLFLVGVVALLCWAWGNLVQIQTSEASCSEAATSLWFLICMSYPNPSPFSPGDSPPT